jgi:hypothetical protein
MITEWTKRHKDGRTENLQLSPEEIDFSSPTMSVSMAKVSRVFDKKAHLLDGIGMPDVRALGLDYKAMDVKMFKDETSGASSSGHHCLYLVYATLSDGALRSGPPFGLFFSKYDAETNTFVSKNIEIPTTVYGGVSEQRKVSINRFSNGTLWVCFMNYAATQIISCTSSDEGATWTGFKMVAEGSSSSQTYYEENDASIGIKLQGHWHRRTYPLANGGYMYRSESASLKNASYCRMTATGTDFYLVTYGTKAKYSASLKWCGQMAVYIDGVHHTTVDLSSYNNGYRKNIKLNAYPLSDTQHTVVIYHRSGKYFFVDGLVAQRNSKNRNNLFLGDAIIRQQSGLQEEAIIAYSKTNTSPPVAGTYPKQDFIVVDRSGSTSDFATANATSYLFRDNYESEWDSQMVFHENNRGLWAFSQNESNGKHYIHHYLYQGQTDKTADYSAGNWKNMLTRPPSDRRAVRYSAGSLVMGGVSFLSTAYANSVSRVAGTYPGTVSVSPDLEFNGIEFEGEGPFKTTYQAFNFPITYTEDYIGILSFDADNRLWVYEAGVETEIAQISDISDYTIDVEVSRDATSDPASLRLSIFNANNEMNTRRELSQFYSLLPSSFSDKITRLVWADVLFDQGEFYYETRVFTGVLGEISESYEYEKFTIDISAYDYSKLLANFRSPYFLVYANYAMDWAESGNDYLSECSSSVSTEVSIREREAIESKDPETGTVTTVNVGWDVESSLNAPSFTVDITSGVIKQDGYGLLITPDVGVGDENIGIDFYPTTVGQGVLEVGFQTSGWTSGTSTSTLGSYLTLDLLNKSCNLYIVETASSLAGSCFVNWKANHWYRIGIETAGPSIRVNVTEMDSNIVSSTLKGERTNANWKDAKRIYIGARSSPGGLVYWDNLFMRPNNKDKKPLKTDKWVAEDLVSRAFQAIIPLVRDARETGEYFTTLVSHPGSTYKDTLDRLSVQNSKRWYFSPSGKLMWENVTFTDPVYLLTDDDFMTLSRSFNPSLSKNWIEAVDDELIPKVRLSVADVRSVLRDGIRFEQVSDSDITNVSQARAIAANKFYESSENADTVDATLIRPLVFIQPRDIVKVNSEAMGILDADDSFETVYFVSKWDFRFSNGQADFSIILSSKAKALLEQSAAVYENRYGGK